MQHSKIRRTFFHQIKGTAMGTSMAVNLANLFMGKFETDLLNGYRNKYNAINHQEFGLDALTISFSLKIMMNQD